MGIEALTLEGGGTIEDLDLDFTLPGYPDVDLKVCVCVCVFVCDCSPSLPPSQPHGRDTPVTIHNLDEYLKVMSKPLFINLINPPLPTHPKVGSRLDHGDRSCKTV